MIINHHRSMHRELKLEFAESREEEFFRLLIVIQTC